MMEKLMKDIYHWEKTHAPSQVRDEVAKKTSIHKGHIEELLTNMEIRSGEDLETFIHALTDLRRVHEEKPWKGTRKYKGDSSTGMHEPSKPWTRHQQESNKRRPQKATDVDDSYYYKDYYDDRTMAKAINSAASTGWNPNKKFIGGESPLLIMIRENRPPGILSLLTAGADVNHRNDNGVSALDEAIKTGNPALVEMLIAFGASPEMVTKWLPLVKEPKRQDPKQLLARTKILGLLRESIVTHVRRHIKTNPLLRDFVHEYMRDLPPSAVDRVLCLDGGGIRGLATIVMLRQVEHMMGRPIRECFDVIGGTSIGGILALAIAKGLSLDECQDLLLKLKTKVFSGGRTYNTEPLEAHLKETFGSSTKMCDLSGPRVIVTAVKADVRPPQLYLFRNYKTLRLEDEFHAKNLLVWQVARATSAAPSYFHPYEQFLDGGLLANNPTLDIMRVVHESKGISPKVMVSMGTGSSPLKAADVPDLPGYGAWSIACHPIIFRNFIEMILSGLTMSIGLPEERASEICKALKTPYFRFEPRLLEDVDLDCTDDTKIKNMMREAQKYIRGEENDRKFAALKELLNR